ncbi:MAG: type II secretion system protein [Planctomycetota bacterium]
MSRKSLQRGFTLIELMAVIMIIAVIASFTLPTVFSSRASANEKSVIATMRTLVTGQSALRSSAKIDTNSNGVGEYGYLAELSGGMTLRGGFPPLDPPLLSAAFRNVTDGTVIRSGYVFRMFLPDADGIGLPEASDGGPQGGANDPDAAMSETFWACYAWPVTFGVSGRVALFANQQGEILKTTNETQQYGNLVSSGGNVPAPEAAFLSAGTAGAITGPTAVGTVGVDGQRWLIVN